MTGPLRPPPPISDAHKALMFPTLTPALVARLTARGTVRAVAREQVAHEAGDTVVPFFVVRSSRIDIIQPSASATRLSSPMARVSSPAKATCSLAAAH